MARAKLAALLALALALALPAGIGCNAEFCDIQDCTGGSGVGGGSGGGGGAPIQCELAPGEAIGERCGVFVKAGATGGDGTQGAPFGTLAEGIAKLGAKGGTVYACAGNYTGSIALPGGVSIVGGVHCDDWVYDAAGQSRLDGTADVPAIVVSGGSGGTSLEGLDVHALDAESGSASSIGVVSDQVALDLVRVTIVAGDGKDGDPHGPLTPLVQGSAGPAASCNPSTPPASQCSGPKGGTPGHGAVAPGAGDDAGPTVLGGQPGSADCAVAATAGASPSEDGPDGAGQTTLGTLSVQGFANPPASESAGQPGTPGAGGGGGAGIVGGCGATDSYGGYGGNGGCGGMGGAAGNPGGSSIALVLIDAVATFSGVSLTARRGGNGGNGQAGQQGAPGSPGGAANAMNGGCGGGPGGIGSNGGKGGGGAGGHSLAVAYVGAKPGLSGVTTAIADAASFGGKGADASRDGSPGQRCAALSFADGTCD